MTERQVDAHIVDQDETCHTIKRRGILAAAAVAVTGLAIQQSTTPVAAASSLQFADTTAAVSNNTLGKTSLIAQAGFADPAGFLSAATVFAVNASGTSAPALVAIGALSKGSAAAISGAGGTNGPGLFGTGGTPSGDGVLGVGAGASNPGGTHSAGVFAVGGSGSGSGVEGTGGGNLGIGIKGTGAVSGIGVQGTSGDSGPAGVDGVVLSTHASPNAIAVRARDQSTNGSGIGVRGDSTAGLGGQFTGGKAPLQLVPQASGTGAPTTGTHAAGELYVDSVGALFYCTTGGTPGTWISLSTPGAAATFITLPTPDRFVDTRINLGGVQGPVPANSTRTFQMTGRTGQSGNAALVIPDSAKTLVGNLTVIGAAGIPLGSFLTLWPGGAQPTVSNINFGPAATSGAIANAFVVGLATVGGHGNVNVFNLSACDYLLDVTGYFT